MPAGRSLWCIVLLVFLTLMSQAHSSDLTTLAALYPQCSLSCMVEFIPKSPCYTASGLNTTCICINATLNGQISLCASKSCSIKELLTTQNASATACNGPVRDSSADLAYISLSVGCFALVGFIVRIVTRLSMQQKKLFWDDYVMIIAVLVAIPPTVFGPLLAHYGIGKDIWTLPFDDITDILKFFFLGEICYLVGLGLVKISILFFFLRVFPVRHLQIIIYIVVGLCTGYSIAFFFATLFQCTPISYAWEQWHGETEGHCNDYHLQGYLAAGINITLDLIILILPLKQISELDLSKRKRFSCMLMFLVGTFVTVVSAIRLKSLVQFRDTTNPTYDYLAPGYWSVVELDISILCACMPAIYALVKIFWPKLVSGTAGETHTMEPKHSRSGSASPFSPRLSKLRHQNSEEFHFWEDSDPNSHPLRNRSLSSSQV